MHIPTTLSHTAACHLPSIKRDPSLKSFTVDFETYYKDKVCSVKTLGNRGYVAHPDFECYMVSIVERGGEKREWCGDPLSPGCPWHWIEGQHVFAHNAGFDFTVFTDWVAVRWAARFGKDIPRPGRWSDTTALCVYYSLPRSLAGAYRETFDGREMSKQVRNDAEGKTGQDLKDEGSWDSMVEYCLDDSRYTNELIDALYDLWPTIEDDAATDTFMTAYLGFRMDWDALTESIQKLNDAKDTCRADMPWIELGYKELSPQGVAKVCRSTVINVTCAGKQFTKAGELKERLGCGWSERVDDSTDHNDYLECPTCGTPDLIRGYLEPPKSFNKQKPFIEPWLARWGKQFTFVSSMTRYRTANTLLKKLETYQNRKVISPHTGNLVVDFGFKYGAAHTLRWGGDSGTNVQAFHRGEVEGVNIRHLILPPSPEELLYIWDYAQIEPRVLAWIVGDLEFLESLAEGFNPYEAHAKGTMGWEPKGQNLKEENPELYALAKARVLGLGYGCGGPKFQVVAKVLAGLDLDLQTCRATVAEFREQNKKITTFWDTLNSNFRRSIGGDYTVQLPSGRDMTYYNVTAKRGQVWAQVERGAPHKMFYGGKLCENVTQSIARDVFVAGLNEVGKAGYRNVFHVHDEGITAVPRADAEEHGKAVKAAAEFCPKWLAGVKIEVDGGLQEHYVKD